MSLVTGSYPSFLGGVSQQDATVRNPTQVSEAVNAWFHAAVGTGKRPPAQAVAILRSNLDPTSHFHSIARDDYERYIVVIGNRSIAVFDHVTGHEYDVVVTGNSLEYLACDGKEPWSMFSTATIADTTIITNRGVNTKTLSVPSPGTLYGSVQTVSDLPKGSSASSVPNGAIYRIVGSTNNEFDDYYVQKQSSSVYQECQAPGIPYKFDSATFPHLLKRIPDPLHGDGFYFSFGPGTWGVRSSGDAESNPDPSVIGSAIQDVCLHRNRLVMLSGENILMSETNDLFNLWRTTVTQVLDGDPIDVSVASNGVTTLYYGVPYQSVLFLAASGSQHAVTADPYLAAKYVHADVVNNYGSTPYVRPKMMGDSLYFVQDGDRFVNIREYFVSSDSLTGDAASVTSHVPRYIKGRIRSLATVVEADCVVASVDTLEESQVYAYFVRWAGDEKQQSAWTRWTISGVGKVVHMHALGQDLYLVAEAPAGGCELLKINLSLTGVDEDATQDYDFLLDRQAVLAPTYQPLGDMTWVDLPYSLSSLQNLSVLKTDDWADPGAYLTLPAGTHLDNGGTRIVIPGNAAGGRVVVGLDYECKVTLTKPQVRNNNQTVLVGRCQVRDISVAYKDACYFEVEVKNQGLGHTELYATTAAGSFNARTLDSSEFKLSSPSFSSGTQRFPVLGNSEHIAISLVNGLPFQCWWQSAQWRGMFVSQSQV